MLHLRLITPADRTDDVVRLIEKTVGTAHLVVLPGAARNPAGDVVMCEQLTDATHEESTLSVTYVAFITLATMIAACGVVLDNAILIVGAMAVGPEFGPLAGICTSVVQRHPRLALRSLTALLVGFAVAMLI